MGKTKEERHLEVRSDAVVFVVVAAAASMPASACGFAGRSGTTLSVVRSG